MIQSTYQAEPSVQRFPVLDVGISPITMADALATVRSWVAAGERQYVNVCTVHTLLECHDSPRLQQIVNAAGLATPDGMPLVWIGKLHGQRIERVYGPDLMLALCNMSQHLGYRHFFYGGGPGVPEQLAAALCARFPALQVAGAYSPPFRTLTPDEEQEIARMINASKADIVWVGLGTPKQDYWLGQFRPLLDAPVLIAVGAAFDFLSGRVRQAPRWIQRSGFEWLFRLAHEPRRLWRRYLLGNPRFIFLMLRQLWQRRLQGRQP